MSEPGTHRDDGRCCMTPPSDGRRRSWGGTGRAHEAGPDIGSWVSGFTRPTRQAATPRRGGQRATNARQPGTWAGRKRLEPLYRCLASPALPDERAQCNAAGQVELKLETPWRRGHAPGFTLRSWPKAPPVRDHRTAESAQRDGAVAQSRHFRLPQAAAPTRHVPDGGVQDSCARHGAHGGQGHRRRRRDRRPHRDRGRARRPLGRRRRAGLPRRARRARRARDQPHQPARRRPDAADDARSGRVRDRRLRGGAVVRPPGQLAAARAGRARPRTW